METIIFTPKNHYYSGPVIKKINPDLVIGTPTLSKQENIFKIIKIAGFYYFFSMLLLKLYHLIKGNSVKRICKKNNIRFYYTKNINNKKVIDLLDNIKPKIVIVLFFNQIIIKDVIDKCKNIINVHPSLLPYYKGVMPVFHVLANNEKHTGVTTHYLEEEIDTGNIIDQKKIIIEKKDTFDSLYKKCAFISVDLILKTVEKVRSGYKGRKQKKGNYFSFVNKNSIKKFRKNNKRFL